MAVMSNTEANKVFIVFSPLISFLISDSGHAVGSFPPYANYILQTPTEIRSFMAGIRHSSLHCWSSRDHLS